MTYNIRITLEDNKFIDVELYEEVAPISVANFLKLVDQKYFDGIIFHRIIKNFMVQTGGYKIDGNNLVEADEVETIKGEFSSNGVINDLKHTKGILSMARSQAMDSAGSQFFIMLGEAPHLDGSYAAFGKVIKGMDIVESIEKRETVNGDSLINKLSMINSEFIDEVDVLDLVFKNSDFNYYIKKDILRDIMNYNRELYLKNY